MAMQTVMTKYGCLSGVTPSEGRYTDITYYHGVPYAKPPVGDLRWRPPVSPDPWDGVRKCDTIPDRCPQAEIPAILFEPFASDFYFHERPAMSEDCLYLDIASGASVPGEKRPVYLWFHGGGLSSGEATEVEFDPSELARKGIVVVSVGQRLNIFGYLVLPQLSAEQGGKSGNYGLMDGLKALEWVYENIEAFGGDPENITIGGQSGGTWKTGAIAASPAQKGRVKRVINESMLSWKSTVSTIEAETKNSINYLKSIGIDPELPLEELRAIPTQDLLRKQIFIQDTTRAHVPSDMVCDGELLLSECLDEGLKKYASDCDFLSGINYGECQINSMSLASKGSLFTAQDVKNAAREVLGDLYDKYDFERMVDIRDDSADHVSRRMAAEGLTSNRMFRGLMIDRIFGMTRVKQHARGKSYCYLFSHITPDRPEDKGTPRDNDQTLAWHSSELWYTFASLREGTPPCRPWKELDFQLADQISDYWANFIKTGDPNGDGLPCWPASGDDYGWMELGDELCGHQGIHTRWEEMLCEYMMRYFKLDL